MNRSKILPSQIPSGRACQYCGALNERRRDAKYCSKKCKNRAAKRRLYIRAYAQSLARGDMYPSSD